MKTRLFAAAAAAMLAVCLPARADLVQIGSNFTVDNTNFIDTFTDNALVLTGNGVNAPTDSGQLQINEQVVNNPDGTEWVIFNFSSTGGGPLAGDPTTFWEGQVENIQFTTPVALIGFYEYWSVNGTPFSGISNIFSNTAVVTNPVTGSGEVMAGFFPPGAPSTTQTLFTNLDPYDFYIGPSFGMDAATANGWTIAGLFAVPEPSSVALLGLGAVSSLALLRRRRRS